MEEAGWSDNRAVEELFEEEPRAVRTDPSERVEQGLVLAANAIWAVVGLVLWLPQIARVVLTSAARLVHAALTRQPADAARGPIRRVSRFYVDGFMRVKRSGAAQARYSARDLRLRRLLLEVLWAGAFYLVLLRIVSPELFAVAWQWIVAVASWSLDRLAEALAALWAWLPEAWRQLAALGPRLRIGLVALAVVVLLLAGWLLGRRR